MNEYVMYANECNAMGVIFKANSHEAAVVQAKEHIDQLKDLSAEWSLFMKERDENPELHNTLDMQGSFHQLFIQKFSFEEDGTMIEDGTMWDESVDLSFDSGTAGEIIVKKADTPVDDSGTANE